MDDINSGNNTGGMKDTQDCINFCAEKGILPDTEMVGSWYDWSVMMMMTIWLLQSDLEGTSTMTLMMMMMIYIGAGFLSVDIGHWTSWFPSKLSAAWELYYPDDPPRPSRPKAGQWTWPIGLVMIMTMMMGLQVTSDQIEAVYDKLREKNDRITRYVLDVTKSAWYHQIYPRCH